MSIQVKYAALNVMDTLKYLTRNHEIEFACKTLPQGVIPYAIAHCQACLRWSCRHIPGGQIAMIWVNDIIYLRPEFFATFQIILMGW